jgi:hypothetical protein
MITRPVLGPNGVRLLEHVLAVLAEWPRLTLLLSQDPAPPDPAAGGDPALRDHRILARILTGLLGPAPGSG